MLERKNCDVHKFAKCTLETQNGVTHHVEWHLFSALKWERKFEKTLNILEVKLILFRALDWTRTGKEAQHSVSRHSVFSEYFVSADNKYVYKQICKFFFHSNMLILLVLGSFFAGAFIHMWLALLVMTGTRSWMLFMNENDMHGSLAVKFTLHAVVSKSRMTHSTLFQINTEVHTLNMKHD